MSIPPSLRIGILDNASHSLERGYELCNKGGRDKNPLLLKEAIIWIHHGIELCLKQLLVQSNEYLVFENIDEAVKKLAHLRRQPNMNQATVFDLFDHGEGAYTVGFNKLIERVATILSIPELATGAPLRESIKELTNYRNKIIHFSIEVELEEIATLLTNLMEPFLTLLEQKIEDQNFVLRRLPYVRANAKSVTEVYKLRHKDVLGRVVQLINRFDSQEISGSFFGINENIILPKITDIQLNFSGQSQNRSFTIDILARSFSEQWIIELRLSALLSSQVDSFINKYLFDYKQFIESKSDNLKVRAWLIVMKTDSGYYRHRLNKNDIFSSSEKDLESLEKLII